MPRESRYALVVALGGGGDVIAGYMLSDIFLRRGLRPILVSLAWERLAKDPLPGPRSLNELSGLEMISESLGRSTESCAYPSGSVTNQGALTANLGIQENYIVEPSGGVRSVLAGLRELRQRFAIEEVWGIDVGGDVLAGEPLPSLTSPLADALMLAALTAFDPRARVAVVAPGIDGELPSHIWKSLLRDHIAKGMVVDWCTFYGESIRTIGELLDHRSVDSEVTAAVVRAYQGLAGTLVMRDSGVLVEVGLACLPIAVYRAHDIFHTINHIARVISDAESLDLASDRLEKCGYFSELRFERAKASKYHSYPLRDGDIIADRVFQQITDAHANLGADYVAERFVSDRLRVHIRSVQEAVSILQRQGRVTCAAPFLQASGKSG
jgi:hypothetical protein